MIMDKFILGKASSLISAFFPPSISNSIIDALTQTAKNDINVGRVVNSENIDPNYV